MSLSTSDNFKTNHSRFALSCSAGSEMAIKEAVFVMFSVALLVVTDEKQHDESAVLGENLFLTSVNDGGGNGIGEEVKETIDEITEFAKKKKFKRFRKRVLKKLDELSTMTEECASPPSPPHEEVKAKISEIAQLVKKKKFKKNRKQVLGLLNELSTMTEDCEAPPTSPPEPECESGWVKHGESCYYIDDTPTQAWSTARAACQSRGADLPIIKSADENEFIADLVFAQDTITWGGAWIGILRNQADDKLYWIDGTPVAGGYTAWTAGNPSNSGGREDCGHIMGQVGAGWEHQEKLWNDVPCALTASWFRNRYPVILCEKSLI